MIYTKRGNLVSKNGLHKHYSRLYVGFLKQVADQEAKPEITSVDTGLISYDEEEGGYGPLKQKFFNNKWNGMNLKNLLHACHKRSGSPSMNTRYQINRAGMYYLSMGNNGRHRLKKLREKYNRTSTNQ